MLYKLLAIEGLTILEEETPVTRFDVHSENQSLVAAGGGIIRVWARPTGVCLAFLVGGFTERLNNISQRPTPGSLERSNLLV